MFGCQCECRFPCLGLNWFLQNKIDFFGKFDRALGIDGLCKKYWSVGIGILEGRDRGGGLLFKSSNSVFRSFLISCGLDMSAVSWASFVVGRPGVLDDGVGRGGVLGWCSVPDMISGGPLLG